MNNKKTFFFNSVFSVIISFLGWSTILALGGMLFFLFINVLPLFQETSLEKIGALPLNSEWVAFYHVKEGLWYTLDHHCSIHAYAYEMNEPHLKSWTVEESLRENMWTLRPRHTRIRCFPTSQSDVFIMASFEREDVYLSEGFLQHENQSITQEQTHWAVKPQIHLQPFGSIRENPHLFENVQPFLQTGSCSIQKTLDHLTGLLQCTEMHSSALKVWLFQRQPYSSAFSASLIPLESVLGSDPLPSLYGSWFVGNNELWLHVQPSLIRRFELSSVNGFLFLKPLESLILSVRGVPLEEAGSLTSGQTFWSRHHQYCAVWDAFSWSHQDQNEDPEPLKPLWTEPCLENSEWQIRIFPAHRARYLLQVAYRNSFIEHFYALDTVAGQNFWTQSLSNLPLQDVSTESIQFSHFKMDHSQQFFWLFSDKTVFAWRLNAPNSLVSWKSLFSPIHYPGYSSKSFVWQAFSSDDLFQIPKYSIVPLIWGSLKSALYALIIGVPIAFGAVIIVTEFFGPVTRRRIKVLVEILSIIPTVALGYLAAFTVSPWLQQYLVGILLLFLLTPFFLYVMGLIFENTVKYYFFDTIKARVKGHLLIVISLLFFLESFMVMQLGRWLESRVFGGSIHIFLEGGEGQLALLWALLIFPIVWFLGVRLTRRMSRSWKLLGALCAPLFSLFIGILLSPVFDVRHSLGPYHARNTLVVSIMLGLCIVPILYSLIEDALLAFPQSLRAASLACGATMWQTLLKVTLPGIVGPLFSAFMIAFGRAMGETMIAMMATGNSGVMKFSPFDSLRTLAANIATEFPETPPGSLHYKLLFLCALILMSFSFILNSLAEIVRVWSRKKQRGL